jgi:hypothetical protein
MKRTNTLREKRRATMLTQLIHIVTTVHRRVNQDRAVPNAADTYSYHCTS